MHFDAERVRLNVSKATTDDLLDRVTVYRSGMEPAALEMIESELASRGVFADHIEAHAQQRDRVLMRPDGVAETCSFCPRPAVAQGWGWHRLLGVLPVVPRYYSYCERHEPEKVPESENASE